MSSSANAKLLEKFYIRLKDLNKVEKLIELLNNPVKFFIEKDPDNLRLELISLLSDKELKEKFGSVECVEFLSLCDSKYNTLKKSRRKELFMFAST
jgi:hypothetical protein